MRKTWLIILISMSFLILGGLPAAAAPVLFGGWASNVDGVVTDNGVGSLGDDSLFDGDDTGLGTISFTISDAGDHFVGLFVDHEFSQPINTYYNEYGGDNGALDSRQSWEIDEPGYSTGPILGDIYDNFVGSDGSGSMLDDSSSLDPANVDDVSMAIGWNFSLDAGEEAVISFLVSEILSSEIASAFYLTHSDPDSQEVLFFTSGLTITTSGGGGDPVPEPASMLLLGSGLVGLAAFGRKRFDKK